jgi:hypothetical protein
MVNLSHLKFQLAKVFDCIVDSNDRMILRTCCVHMNILGALKEKI